VARSILSVVAGYLTCVIGVGIGLAFLLFAFPDAFPREPGPYEGPRFVLLLELAMSAVVAVAGGYVCGLVARRAEARHGLYLLGLMLVLGVVSALVEAGLKPLWSSLSIPIVGAVGVYLGAKLRQRHRERRALER
jgi:hypothetical protein